MDLSPDYEDLFKILNAYKIKYLVAGAYAVMYYSASRYTKDIDIWVIPEMNDSALLGVVGALSGFFWEPGASSKFLEWTDSACSRAILGLTVVALAMIHNPCLQKSQLVTVPNDFFREGEIVKIPWGLEYPLRPCSGWSKVKRDASLRSGPTVLAQAEAEGERAAGPREGSRRKA